MSGTADFTRPRYNRCQHAWPGAPEARPGVLAARSEEHTSELQSLAYLVCRLLLEKKKKSQPIHAAPQSQYTSLRKNILNHPSESSCTHHSLKQRPLRHNAHVRSDTDCTRRTRHCYTRL